MTSDRNGKVPTPIIPQDLVQSLTSAYATLLKRQRTASAAFVRWSSPSKRAHEFAWIEAGKEVILFTGREIRISANHPLHDSINKMMTTIELNPYERELLYGYPYIVGNILDVPIRAPLLTIPITITAEGNTLVIKPHEEVVRLNSLPFRSELDTSAHELALNRLIDATPALPLTAASLKEFCDSVSRELHLTINGTLDGRLEHPPRQPQSQSQLPLRIVDCAACFVAPKTSYFLASDLEYIGRQGEASLQKTALGGLLGKRGCQATSNTFMDSRKVYYPFSSNPNQRRVALLTDEQDNHIITVQGPPGTGKSLTIANLVCHLIARGKRVLVTSQKDKALQVVDELLRSLDLAELPMTLLRQDLDSKRELRQRINSIQKLRSVEETRLKQDREANKFTDLAHGAHGAEEQLADALLAEHLIAYAEHTLAKTQSILKRLHLRWNLWEARRAAKQRAPQHSDHHGVQTTMRRTELLKAAIGVLKTAAEHRTGEATRDERNHLRQFSKLLGRSQTAVKNFSVFDRLKKNPAHCHMLLKILPCWIMTPDDVARLFPCEQGLFDVCIIDEASQCDLPSMTPVLYRSKQAVIAGDSKQMQAQRFAFTNNQVAIQAWRQFGLDKFDPDRWLDPSKVDLLQLASVRTDEEVLLDEHFRSLPSIISFSNERWYGGQLRLMRDHDDRRFGDPASPAVRMYHVQEGAVKPGTQENEREAQALVKTLKQFLEDPEYAEASFGVLGLFEEQVRLLNELTADQIPEELRTQHDLVVVNPDGFQGDERDVIFYSLSYDADGMEQSQISARQAEREHIQGMLNVAFTRARDEMHIFHTAKIDQFGMASGSGAIRDWLEHCAGAAIKPTTSTQEQLKQTDSEFEAQVIQALNAKGIKTIPQYPSAGFFIDVVAIRDDTRVAIECDGEVWHLDEHGKLRQEDCVRQEILERAGWRVLRIPYRGWTKDPGRHIERILLALSEPEDEEEEENTKLEVTSSKGATLKVTTYEGAILHALRQGEKEKELVLRVARTHLGYSRLGNDLRYTLTNAITVLSQRGLVRIEEEELFATETARTAAVVTYQVPRPVSPNNSYRRYRSPNRYRRYRR